MRLCLSEADTQLFQFRVSAHCSASPNSDGDSSMSIEVKPITRTFTFGGLKLPDIPGASPAAVRDHYATIHPELNTASISGPELVNGVQKYTFERAIGTKG